MEFPTIGDHQCPQQPCSHSLDQRFDRSSYQPPHIYSSSFPTSLKRKRLSTAGLPSTMSDSAAADENVMLQHAIRIVEPLYQKKISNHTKDGNLQEQKGPSAVMKLDYARTVTYPERLSIQSKMYKDKDHNRSTMTKRQYRMSFPSATATNNTANHCAQFYTSRRAKQTMNSAGMLSTKIISPEKDRSLTLKSSTVKSVLCPGSHHFKSSEVQHNIDISPRNSQYATRSPETGQIVSRLPNS